MLGRSFATKDIGRGPGGHEGEVPRGMDGAWVHQGTGARCPELGALKGCSGLWARAAGSVQGRVWALGWRGLCAPKGAWSEEP